MTIYSSQYGVTREGEDVTHFTLTNEKGYQVEVINYGCTIVAIRVPDRNGHYENIVLAYDSIEDYQSENHYTGAIIGRCANRIRNGNVKLGEQTFQLSKNENGNHLHGGFRGFDKVVWRATMVENEEGSGIDLQYLSPDGEEGYPGNLNVMVRYFLTADSLQLIYAAKSDADTIVNLTQHSYFNLNAGGNITTHQLMINAHGYLPIDHQLIPGGELIEVDGTSFDFRTFKKIGDNLGNDDPQLRIGNGYDHCFALSKNEKELSHAATIYAVYSGRKMELYTTEPGMQLYTGNGLDINSPANFKGPFAALCLETHHFPDSTNHPEFPAIVLKSGEIYRSLTVLKFSNVY